MRVVIDTNLLINGSEDDNNYGNRIIDAVIEHRIEAYANRATLRENALLARQKIKDSAYREKLQAYFSAVQQVEDLAERLDVVEDREDNKLVESAVAAGADYLISSDRHLLDIEQYGNIEIISPEAFWNRFEDASGSGWQNWLNQFMK